MNEESIFADDDFRALSDMYWTEEDEFNAGIHPTQVRERIEQALKKEHVEYAEITYLDWLKDGVHVMVSLDGTVYGPFNFQTNQFD